MADYLPANDGKLRVWGQNFSEYLAAHTAALGLAAGDIAPITAARSVFETASAASIAARQGAESARQAKDTARKEYRWAIRLLVRRLQASASVDDGERAALGITIRDTIRTVRRSAAGLSRPTVRVDTGQRLCHKIDFADESTPTRRAKPDGVLGCEIWVKVLPQGVAAPGAGEFAFVALDTASPYLVQYEGADAGKTAHYMLRWMTTGGAKGPWSQAVSATITG